MYNLKLYQENPSIFQRYIALTNQKQILIDKFCKKIIENNISKKYRYLISDVQMVWLQIK